MSTLLIGSAGCQRQNGGQGGETNSGSVLLEAWCHAGQQSERDIIQQQVQDFNARQDQIQVNLTLLPEGSYNSQVQAAALAGDLPDILEFDGPFVYNYVWQNHLEPLDDLISTSTRTNVITSIIEQGTYRGHLYSLGMFDSGLALYGRRSLLEEVDARIPESPEDAWTIEEFETILGNLAENDDDGQVLDLKMNYSGEWYTYAFMPALVSGGGDLIDRESLETASGVLNGEAAVRVMKSFQKWINEAKWVDQNVDDNAFIGGRVALSWVGHWEYRRYLDKWKDDLVLLPLPDFGSGSRTGQGSWNWGITRRCENPESAIRFLEFLLEAPRIVGMTDANAAVPATHEALEESDLYRPDTMLWLFVTQLTEGYGVPRPRTPAYPVITSVFQQAFHDISNGADVQSALDRAAEEINRDISDNRGYPSVERQE
jgi:multiple sugar transport system substrate-binding protein